jgi:hypothetical protein
MRKVMVFLFSASLFWASCGSDSEKPMDQPQENSLLKEITIEDSSITMGNPGLIKWSTFFREFSDSMQYFDITKEKMHFPFVFFSDTISSEDFYDKDYYIMVPPSFIEDCKKANMDLKNELESFENNKLFQYSETGNYKLLIEYLEDGLVAVTHFNKIK